MKKLVLIALCLSTTFFFCFGVKNKIPKIVVLTSKGGNGHMATCDVLGDIFSDYKIILYNPIQDFSHKLFDGEEWYIRLLQTGWLRTINFIARYPGSMYFKIRRNGFKKNFLWYLKKEKPDLLISLIPMLNYPAALAAEHYKIPFIIITLDADLTLWLLDMEKIRNHNFILTVNAKTPRIKQQLVLKHIPKSCVHEVGSPLRKNFFTPKNHQVIRNEWKIPRDKKVVLLIRGGTGSSKLVDYVKMLIKLDQPLHLLVCIGKNTKLINKINHIKTRGPVSFSIIPFTKKIPDLMAISDLLITQPSPNICNEAMHMTLPILIDMTSPCLFWEKATIDWINLYGYGSIFKHMNELNTIVPTTLAKKKLLLKQAKKTIPCFNTKIRKLVTSLIS
jgi:UDP-N-acetylglucosamine:LPS N-acetylglucosamine transferase